MKRQVTPVCEHKGRKLEKQVQLQENKKRMTIICQRLDFEKYGYKNPIKIMEDYKYYHNKWYSMVDNNMTDDAITESVVYLKKAKDLKKEIKDMQPLFDNRLNNMWIDIMSKH
jgi:replication-associated recombination protein RarA